MNKVYLLQDIKEHSISGWLYSLMFIYLYLPVAIFVLGWLTPIVSIPVVVLSAFGFFYVFREGKFSKNNTCFSWVELIVAFATVMLYLIFLGHGEMFAQDYDWNKHHAVVYDLARYKWPVVYQGDVLLTYYLGQYIVPAFLGKILSAPSVIINIFTLLWNTLGLWLVYVFIVEYFGLKKTAEKVFVFAVMVFWGGAILLGSFIYRIPETGISSSSLSSVISYQWLDIYRVRVSFAANTVALGSAYQHVIPAWVSVCLFMLNPKDVSKYVVIGLPLLFSATFGFLYLVLILVGVAVYSFIVEKDKLLIVKRIFSITNLLFIPLALVILIYLSGFLGGDRPQAFGFGFNNMFQHLWFYIVFILEEFLLYAICIYNRYKNNILYYLVVVELMLIPFLSMGVWNDLCTRGNLPAGFILMMMCISFLLDQKQSRMRKIAVCVLILFSAINIVNLSARMIEKTIDGYGDNSFIQDNYGTLDGFALNPDIRVDNAYNYYTFNYSDSLFYNIARK